MCLLNNNYDIHFKKKHITHLYMIQGFYKHKKLYTVYIQLLILITFEQQEVENEEGIQGTGKNRVCVFLCMFV